MHKYEIILYWSEADHAFVMVHGDTQESALKHINQAMTLWIDTARDHDDPIPAPI